MKPIIFSKILVIPLLVCCSIAHVSAQKTQKIGDNPYTIDAQAVLELESTTKGFLLPRMSEAQMNLITTPTEGMILYCTDCGTNADGELRIAYNSIWQTFKGDVTGDVTGNAATVSTNANLTGPITSTGNATSIGSQTGTGVTFAMSASPTFTGTPQAPLAAEGTSTPQLATTEFVTTAIAGLDAGGLMSITEGSNTGYRRADANAANYGDIGDGAVDLSQSTSDSETYGATGPKSTAMGFRATASGYASTAMGFSTKALESASTAMGSGTTASGQYSTAMGALTTASGYASTAMGAHTIASDYGALVLGQYNNTGSTATSATQFSTSAPALVIGNGTGSSAKSDAFVVDFSGNLTASGTLTAGTVTYPNTHNATAGQVLTTDAAGLVSFQNASSPIIEVADEFSAAASQTVFTLEFAPSLNSRVKMYVNGIRISNTAYSISGSTLTYVPANNGGNNLLITDRIQFDYYY